MRGDSLPPNLDDDFQCRIDEWRRQHQLREDDAVLLLVELFRVHQQHWDEIRHREMPSLDQFRSDITKLTEAARTLRQETAALLASLQGRRPPTSASRISRTTAILAAIATFSAGYLIGRFW